MAKKIKLALIDSHALIHRAYHALPPMSTRQGWPTNAVFGFTTMLLKMFTTVKPTHVVAAFDVAGPTFRAEKFKEYKAHRVKAPDDLVEQFDLVKRVVRAFRIPMVEKKGFEADDVIGTLVEKLPGVKKIIVTGDGDTLQLVDQDTTIFTLKRGVTDTILYNEAAVQEKYGFGPELVADFKGLMGDPSDNIPGVAGIGKKSAQALVAKYGGIEKIYENWEDLPTRVKTRLEGKKEEAFFSRDLATIRRDVPLEFDLTEAEIEDFDRREVEKIFQELEFKSLLVKIPKSKHEVQQVGLFGESAYAKASADKQSLPDNYYLVESEAEQEELMKKLAKQKVIAFDTENDRLGAREYPIVGMSFAFKVEDKIEAYYVPVTVETVKRWKDLLEDERVGKVGHNLKYDAEVARQAGIYLKGIVFDSMLASYLLQAGESRQHSLDALAVQELDYQPISITTLIGEKKPQKKMSEVPLKQLARYAAEDAEVSYKLYEGLDKKIKAAGLTRVMDELEVPLIEVLVEIELNGVAVEKKVLGGLQKKATGRLLKLQEKIWRAAGGKFNINSTRQLREVLFEKLNLPTVGITRTQTGYSTAARELEKLRGKHEMVEWLEEYRELAKLLNTYIETLPKLVDEKTGRVYGQFNQTVAATGRLSSSDPNLQNIPVRTELGQEIRKAFVAPKGRRLIKADYSQIELRLVAAAAQDEKMMKAFLGGQDIHAATAAWVYGIEVDKVTTRQRREAKTLNFGVLYGMGASAFGRAANISQEEARSFIERYKEQYKGVAKWIEETIDLARVKGYSETLLGRRRILPEINARAPQVRAQAERMAFNFPLQGTAADILKKAMIEVQALITKRYPEAKLVLTVHDELVVEAPEDYAKELAGAIKKTMEGVMTLDVPLVVDVAMGKNWQEMLPLS